MPETKKNKKTPSDKEQKGVGEAALTDAGVEAPNKSKKIFDPTVTFVATTVESDARVLEKYWLQKKYVTFVAAVLIVTASGVSYALKNQQKLDDKSPDEITAMAQTDNPKTVSKETSAKDPVKDEKKDSSKETSGSSKKNSSSSSTSSSSASKKKSTTHTPGGSASGSSSSGSGGSGGSSGSSSQNTISVYNFAGASYYYAGASQYVSTKGASATFTQASPNVPNAGDHSLIELAVQSGDGQQIVEVGWIVDPILGDSNPHLFVYHWVDGAGTCYNGCGFVQVSSTYTPGDTVSAGTSVSYKINFTDNKWKIYYNGTEVGYFPASLWGGTFTKAGLVQVFGEVAKSTSGTCIEMGNGILGSQSGAARISNFSLIGASKSPALYPFRTKPYSYGSATSTGLRLGGPGC